MRYVRQRVASSRAIRVEPKLRLRQCVRLVRINDCGPEYEKLLMDFARKSRKAQLTGPGIVLRDKTGARIGVGLVTLNRLVESSDQLSRRYISH